MTAACRFSPEDRLALIVLATVADIGSARLRAVAVAAAAGHLSPREVLASISERPHPCLRADDALAAEWSRRLAAEPVAASSERLAAAGVGVTVVGDAAHPTDVADDPHLPPVLFWSGRVGLDPRPRVGIVGTRRATRYGLDLAVRVGRDLADCGIGVVSGLALGIDAAAHQGCLDGGVAAPLAVVGCGVDVVYPRRHRQLWDRVRAAGSIVSEYPPGTDPAPWRFPARNRILAACSDALLVVESAETGGALITAALAAERGVPVLAVPGSVHSRASVGCNRLIADGAAPFLDGRDLLDAIGFSSSAGPADPAAPDEPRFELSEGESALWSALGEDALPLDELAAVVGVPVPAVLAAVSTLEARGLLWVTESTVARRHDGRAG